MSIYEGNNKLSLAECKKILSGDGDEYTDEQIIIIRDWLYHMADIAIEAYELENENSEVSIMENKNTYKT